MPTEDGTQQSILARNIC